MNSVVQTLVTAVLPSLVVLAVAWYLNRKLESFKHDLLHKVHARKILIEKELEFYAKLFEVLTDMRDVMAEFTSPIIHGPPEQTNLEWNQRIHGRAANSFNALYTRTWSYRPFYPQSLEPKIDEFRDLAHRWLIKHEAVCQYMVQNRQDNPSPDLWQSAQKAANEIKEKTEAVIADVRERINQIS